MPRDRHSTLLSSSLLSTLIVLSVCGEGAVKIAQSATLSQLGTQSPAVTRSLAESTSSQPETRQLSQATSRVVRSIKVFFPKKPQSNNNFSYVESVNRTTRSQNPTRFAVEQLIAGPTSAERQRGLVPAVQLTGSSNCGSNFRLSISQGVARLQFCRTVASAGVGDDARLKSASTATLKQFSSVRSVIILDKNGNCLGDMSGENRCLGNSR